jgi:hypothetical protein
MAYNTWGTSWGTAWGNSWGNADTPGPSPEPSPAPEQITQSSGGWYIPKNHREEALQKELAREKSELARIENELAEAERIRASRLEAQSKATEKATMQMEVLQASLEEEISGLLAERVRLMRQIDENEAILILSPKENYE